ncbi:hypothetical protein ACK8P5_25735 (plasmid) [Paenibacillus sp. EC2-1]|uniref:hypothetical protein n=1 Tax=Paenibacillus sp. EC2-1 TaxID=3388665 RepID=UPI003BEF00DD
MQQNFVFRFLSSPSDPRFDNWIDQSHILTFLNSEPGTNALFSFRPFGLLPSRKDVDNKLADRFNSRVVDRITWQTADKPAPSGLPVEATPFAVRSYHESVLQHGFLGLLREAEAFVTGLLTISRPKDLNANVASRRAEAELWDRIDTHMQGRYIVGRRRETIKDALFEMISEYASRSRRMGVEDLAPLIANSKYLPREVIDVAELLFADQLTIRKAIVDEVTQADKEFIETRKFPIQTTSDSIMRETMNDRPHLAAETDDALAVGHSRLLTSVRPVMRGVSYKGVLAAEKPTMEGVQVSHLLVSTRKDSEAFFAWGRNAEHLDSKEGYLKSNQNLAETLTHQGNKLTGSSTADRSDTKEVTKGSDTRVADHGRSGESIIERQPILGGRHAAESIVSRELLYADYSTTDQARISWERILAYGAPIKDGHIELQGAEADRHGSGAKIDQEVKYTLFYGSQAMIDHTNIFVSYDDSEMSGALISNWRLYFDRTGHNARINDDENNVQVERIGKGSRYDVDPTLRVEDDSYNAMIAWKDMKIDNTGKRSMTVSEMLLFDDKIRKNSWLMAPDVLKVDPVDLSARITEDVGMRLEKLSKSSWIIQMILKLDANEKASMLFANWEMLRKIGKQSRISSGYLFSFLAQIGQGGDTDPEMPGDPRTYPARVHDPSVRADKETKTFAEMFDKLASYEHLDALFLEILGGAEAERNLEAAIERLASADRTDSKSAFIPEDRISANTVGGREAVSNDNVFADDTTKKDRLSLIHEYATADSETLHAVVSEIIISHNIEKPRGAIKPDGYLLTSDGSAWEDIWNKYSPGVDIIDVPHSDFNYETLASQVYDLETGVPKKAIGPINKADVIVPIPLHHPLPQHFDLGIDEVPVDNYVIIDVILAINSLMERSKLQYAGTPAEIAMREMFSKLHAWIQGAAPGHPEYNRMYRFARWYAETVVLKLSRHVLHRTYDKWLSGFHIGQGLGLTYDTSGWRYYPGASVMQSTGIYDVLSFGVESYIDGSMTIRGFIDNPSDEGTLDFYMNGDLIFSRKAAGIFQETFDVLMGDNLYEFIFHGTSGRASLSSLEIDGTTFMSAYTTSDDSDTNGLKALMELIKMLLSYYELHHGDGKIKGMLELQQRKMVNKI